MTSVEERLAAALDQQLKSPWAIYRNVAWLDKPSPGAEPQDGEADLVVAHPDRGVMVIEVKGGRVQRVGGQWESLDRFEYGPEGSVLPPPTRGNEVRVTSIYRYKGLESPVVVLAEIDSRIAEEDLRALLYVGATRARSHLVVVAADGLADRLR